MKAYLDAHTILTVCGAVYFCSMFAVELMVTESARTASGLETASAETGIRSRLYSKIRELCPVRIGELTKILSVGYLYRTASMYLVDGGAVCSLDSERTTGHHGSA